MTVDGAMLSQKIHGEWIICSFALALDLVEYSTAQQLLCEARTIFELIT
jgi:hypothetical protein